VANVGVVIVVVVAGPGVIVAAVVMMIVLRKGCACGEHGGDGGEGDDFLKSGHDFSSSHFKMRPSIPWNAE
jgi:hypothetical protein